MHRCCDAAFVSFLLSCLRKGESEPPLLSSNSNRGWVPFFSVWVNSWNQVIPAKQEKFLIKETIYANIGGLKYSSLNCCWRRIPSREKDDKSEIRNLVMKGTLLDWIISE